MPAIYMTCSGGENVRNRFMTTAHGRGRYTTKERGVEITRVKKKSLFFSG